MRKKQSLLLITVVLLTLACITLIPTPPPSTITPTMCSGWSCTLEGIVYLEAAAKGKPLSGQLVDLKQASNCSPTAGEHQAITDQDGKFKFEVYLHDTDGFLFQVTADGYQPAQVKLGGFDCLYCSCPPVEIILEPLE